MLGDPNDRGKVNTGGGAYIGGNVTASGDFVGRDQMTTVGNRGIAVSRDVTGSTVITTDGITQEAFFQLLAEMRKLVHQTSLEERKAHIIEGDIQVIEKEAKSPKPDSVVLESKLEGITKVLKAAGGLTEAGKTLLGQVEQAVTWAVTLFS